jgi:hypothetical protein
VSVQASLNVMLALSSFILVILTLRWAFTYVVTRTRIDMTRERQRIQQDALRGYRVNKRVTHWLWKLCKYMTPQPPGKNKS